MLESEINGKQNGSGGHEMHKNIILVDDKPHSLQKLFVSNNCESIFIQSRHRTRRNITPGGHRQFRHHQFSFIYFILEARVIGK